MPATAFKRFEEDIDRAYAIYSQAQNIPDKRSTKLLRNDLLRSAWMIGVGALDAYFCDARADVITRTLRAMNLQPGFELKGSIAKNMLPVDVSFLEKGTKDNSKWRLAARDLIEKDNVLSIDKFQNLINPFFTTGYKFFEAHTLDSLILDYDPPRRLVGTVRRDYKKLEGRDLDGIRKQVRKKVISRINDICRGRHDLIHNWDIPKLAVQNIDPIQTGKALEDIRLFVSFCNNHIETEFNRYSAIDGTNAVTRNQVG